MNVTLLKQETMKILFALLIIASLPIPFACREHESIKFEKKSSGKITCDISAKETTINVGEVPKIKVKLTNNTDEDVYLIGSLDGSEVQWRYPYCYFTIEKPETDVVASGARCGMMNPLREEDFVLLKPKESFDPYSSIDGYGFFSSSTLSDPKEFRKKGTYKIQFHYSTEPDSITKYLGSESENKVDAKIKKMFRQVPHLKVSSNVIEIKVK